MEDDIFAVTNDLNVEDLIKAYDIGVFPWPDPSLEGLVPWFKPQERGVLFFDQFHISKSLKKFLNSTTLKVTFCQNFSKVINECANVKRNNQEGTWIDQKIIKAYEELFNLKKAYSVEVWNENKALVGGMYGVLTDRCVSGESMFFKETGASKLALCSLVKKLRNLGLSYIDTQMVTPVVQAFGGVKISKEDFDNLLINGNIYKSDALFEELQND